MFPLVNITYIRNALNVEVGLPELRLQPINFLCYSKVLPYYSYFMIYMTDIFLSIALQANSAQNLQFYVFLNLVFRRGRATWMTDCHTPNSGHTNTNRVGFEPTIVVFERLRTVHASQRAVTINIQLHNITTKYQQSKDVNFLFSFLDNRSKKKTVKINKCTALFNSVPAGIFPDGNLKHTRTDISSHIHAVASITVNFHTLWAFELDKSSWNSQITDD